MVACSSNITGQQDGWLGGAGGGPLGSSGGGGSGGSGGGADASSASQNAGPTGGYAGGDDASSAVPEASSASGGDASGSADGGAESGSAEGGADGGINAAISFTLLDTSVTTVVQGSPVSGYDPLTDGTTFSLATVGTSLSIRANTSPTTVGSMQFTLDGTYTHTENVTPYTLCGDNGQGTITTCPQLTAGTHTLVATEYSQASLGGTTEGSATITFTITQ